MRILLVEDCQTTRKLLAFYLKANGFEVVSAENGLDAIQKLGIEKIDLVMTDLNMPYMDGIELTRSLRAEPALRHIPVLMVTTEADDTERVKALDAGANGYLVKPVTAESVSRSIKKILKEIMKGGGPDA